MKPTYAVHIPGLPSYPRGGGEYTCPDIVAFGGYVMIEAEPTRFYGGPSSTWFVSDLYLEPTWGDLFGAFGQQLARTLDQTNTFLTGAIVLRTEQRQVAPGQVADVRIVTLTADRRLPTKKTYSHIVRIGYNPQRTTAGRPAVQA